MPPQKTNMKDHKRPVQKTARPKDRPRVIPKITKDILPKTKAYTKDHERHTKNRLRRVPNTAKNLNQRLPKVHAKKLKNI